MANVNPTNNPDRIGSEQFIKISGREVRLNFWGVSVSIWFPNEQWERFPFLIQLLNEDFCLLNGRWE